MGEFYSFDIGPNERKAANGGCWHRRTCLEKFLLIFTILLLISLAACAAIGYLLFDIRYDPPRDADTVVDDITIITPPQTAELIAPKDETILDVTTQHNPAAAAALCLTAGCVHAASTMLRHMNRSAEPCTDFHQFACGGFVSDTYIPDDRANVNIFTEIVDRLQLQIRTLIAEPVRPEAETRPVRMAKQLYAACLNQSRIEERGLEPTQRLAARFGGWPVLVGDAWDAAAEWYWADVVQRFAEAGLSTAYIFTLSVQTDLLDSSRRTLDLDQTWLGVEREYLVEGLDDPIVQAYYTYMVDTAVKLGANRSRAEIELKEALQFEIELAMIGLPNEERRNATALHNPMQVHAIQAAYPFVDWVRFINALLQPAELRVDANETIIVTVPTFFAQLTDLLGRTPNRTVANYLLWRAVEATVIYAPDGLRDLLHEFERAQSGQVEKTPRWQECIDTTSAALPISLAALYVRKHFDGAAKAAAVAMVQNIRMEFERVLHSVPWMDEATRTASWVKLQAIVAHVGYPDELGDDALLEAYYRDLDIDAERYLESVLRVNRFDADYEWRQLRLPVNKTDWVRHAKVASVNALYRTTENSIMVPAGILQGRFFAADRPAYLNYGAIGFVIGHEITHGFDDKGRQFDALGNVQPWWHSATVELFLTRTECIVEQFGNYTEPISNLTLNGIRTLGENIADSGGAKIAYNAYQHWSQQHADDGMLPGLPYTQQQLFWIATAQNWCSVSKAETLSATVTTDVHSPDVFRVLGPLQNSADFARDFGCAVGTAMNPERKCGMW